MTGARDSVTLLPCPFCGCEAAANEHRLEEVWSVRCLSCDGAMPYSGLSEDEAIAAWNTRHREAAQAELVEALKRALDHYERNICHHEDTFRGGILWTICTHCGAKWADDEGGFKPFAYPAEIEAAYATLSKINGGEA